MVHWVGSQCNGETRFWELQTQVARQVPEVVRVTEPPDSALHPVTLPDSDEPCVGTTHH